MELLYIWIEDFRSIQKQGFSFSPKLKFEIETTANKKNSKQYSLTVSDRVISANLFADNILNATAIIGKNGSGKSSLLHCLKLLGGQLHLLTSPLIFCLFNDKKKAISTYYYKNGGINEMTQLNVKVISTSSRYIVEDAKPYSIDRIIGNTVTGLDFDFNESIATCFYSNAFDSHKEDIYKNIINISTNYRVEEFLKGYIGNLVKNKQNINRDRDEPLQVYPSHIGEYHRTELHKLIKFLSFANSNKAENLPPLPESIVINFNSDDYINFTENSITQTEGKAESLKWIHKSSLSILNKLSNPQKQLPNLLTLCLLHHTLKNSLLAPGESFSILNNIFSKAQEQPSKIFDIISKELTHAKFKNNLISVTDILKSINSKQFVNNLSKAEFIIRDYAKNDKSRFEIKINAHLWPILSAIYSIATNQEFNFINYTWAGGLSTGQEAFLLHFARLFDIRRNVGNKTLWLFIDEGDLYFHPQMQKEYFNQLLILTALIFAKNKIQIILTTHSPFIASDLPKRNLIFLTRDEQGNCVSENPGFQQDTFGANIHELYSNSFFLEGSLMGDFAKSKIDEVIKWCSDKEGLDRADYMKSIAMLVGEPIIKVKLAEMIAVKLGTNVELARLLEQQDYINKRIQELNGNDSN